MKFDAKRAIASRVVLLRGDEAVLLRRAVGDLLAAVPIATEDFDFSTLTADAAPPVEWLGSAMTAPFMAEKRVVVVRSVGRAEARAYEGVSFRLPESALLILVADGDAGSEDRERRSKANVAALEKIVKAAQGTVLEFKSDPAAAKAMLSAEASGLGRRLSPRAAETLLEMCGGSIGRALEEFEKVALFTESDPIPESAVEAVVSPSREWSVWKLVDAVAAAKPEAALAQLRILLSTGKRPETAALETILPQLARQLRLLWQGRLVLDHGSEAAAAGFPDRPNFGAEPEYRQRKILERSRSMDPERIARLFTIVADADAAIKGLRDAHSAGETLERAVLSMCLAARPGSRGAGRNA